MNRFKNKPLVAKRSIAGLLLASVSHFSVMIGITSLAAFSMVPSAQAAELTEIRGKVVDQSTQKVIAGAIVRLKETGVSVTTGNDGTYRFLGVAAGQYTLEVTYIGYESEAEMVTVTANNRVHQDFAIGFGDMEEIIVVGSRSARASALNHQRASDNIANVVSGDLLGRFPDNNVAEAMRRLPGVTFQREERTGDGQYISIRGLDSGLNNIKVNGMNAAQTGRGNRRVSMNVMGAASISKIVVNKTLLPNHDGAGIGGAVELHTVTPLELNKELITVSAEGNYNDFREKLGGKFSGTYSNVFGSEENFGFLISGTYSKRHLRSYETDVPGVGFFPSVIPADLMPAGKYRSQDVNQITKWPFVEGSTLEAPANRWSKFDTSIENISGTIAFDYRITDDTTFTIIGNFNQQKTDMFRDNFGVNYLLRLIQLIQLCLRVKR